MSIRLSGRRWDLTVDDGQEARTWGKLDAKTPGLEMEFKVVKTPDTKPNDGDFTIYNLNSDSRQFLQRRNLSTIFRAGYAESVGQIFKGNTELTNHQFEDVDWKSLLSCKDGGAALRDIIIFKTFAKGTLTTTVIENLIKKLTSLPNGLQADLQKLNQITQKKIDLISFKPKKPGPKEKRKTKKQKVNPSYEVQQAKHLVTKENQREKSGDNALKRALLLRGNAIDKLEHLCWSVGLECIITDQQLSIFPKGLPLLDETIILDRYSGLIGSPEKTEDGLKIRSLLRHDFNPGMLVELDSRYFGGIYLLNRVEHSGNSRASDWYSDLFCTEYTG
jgi:hypothetical protein